MDASKVPVPPSQPQPITQDVAAHNIKVIAEFPGLGNRLVTRAKSWWTSGQTPQGDYMARIVAAKDHALNRAHHVNWALQVGYEYALGYKEDVSAINEAVVLTFNKAFGELGSRPLMRENNEPAESFEIKARQLHEYKAALKGLKNLCLVYGQRYLKDESKSKEIAQLLDTYALQYWTYCRAAGLPPEQIEGLMHEEMQHMRHAMQVGYEENADFSTLTFQPLEGPIRQKVIDAIKGYHTEDEVAEGGARKQSVAFRGEILKIHPQAMTDIERTPIFLEGRHIQAGSQENSLTPLLDALSSTLGPQYSSEALSDIVQILVSQTYSGFVAAKAHEAFGGPKGAADFGLKMQPNSFVCSLVRDGDDFVFIKQVSFNKVDRNDPEAPPQSVVEVVFKIRIPKSKFLEGRLHTENLADVQMSYALSEHGPSNKN